MILCNNCKKHIHNVNELNECAVCNLAMHTHCSNWMCINCYTNNFPYGNVTNEVEFINCLDNNIVNNDLYTLPQVDHLNFNLMDLNTIHDMLPLRDVDPDVNYFNTVNWENLRSDYHTENTFNDGFKKMLGDSQNFSIMHLNIRSVHKNFSNFEHYLHNINVPFKIIGLTETWTSDSTLGRYKYDNHVLYENCRPRKKGGGVALYISDDYSSSLRQDLSIMNDSIESLFVEVEGTEVSNNNTIVGVIYRPPKGDLELFLNTINEMLLKLNQENKTLYIMGDFNLDLLKINQHRYTATFIETMLSHSLLPMINKPTRIKNDSETLIDNIFCNKINDHCLFNAVLLTDISDHFPIVSITKAETNQRVEEYISKRLYNQETIKNFKDKLNEVDWDDVLNLQDCQSSFSLFHKRFCQYFNECFPIVRIKIGYRNRKPWLTPALKKSIKVKNKLYGLSIKSSTVFNINKYLDYKRKLQNLLRRSERNHYEELFRNNVGNIKKSWEIIKEVINDKKKAKMSNKFLIDGSTISDNNVIAKAFNTFFANIGKTINDSIPNTNRDSSYYMSPMCPNSIFIQPTDNNDIHNIIVSLKNKSPGWDGVSPQLIKQISPNIINILVHIVNLSLNHGLFPSELKLAKVIPVFKGGDASQMNNYRPVSLLSVHP